MTATSQPVSPFCRMIHITVNGQPETVAADATLSILLERRGLADVRLAVERNGGIVPRMHHAGTALAEGDVLEIVVAVGGG
ncbi:MAG: sulfur carrier protein ThiS [Azoarcus sp.]|nr:sulfur carrier protein ThiS [Azoarcus sp.]